MTVLAYHDVEEALTVESLGDTVTTSMLWQQLTWMTDNGYQFVSLDALLKARQGLSQLPQKAALLTFDDGYASLYTKVLPILQRKRIPAVAALVGSWLAVPEEGVVRYGDQFVPRSRFLTRAQAQALTASGLVEFASHTYNLHKGILSNPQGNTKPSAITAEFLGPTRGYESSQDYAARIRRDLKANQDFIAEFASQTPRAVVWPFGRYSGWTNELARELQLEVAFSLDDATFNPLQDFSIGRKYIRAQTTLADFSVYVQQKPRMAGLKLARAPLMSSVEALASDERELSRLLQALESQHVTGLALTLPDKSECVLDELGTQVGLARTTWQAHTRLGLQIWLDVGATHPCFIEEAKREHRVRQLASLGVFQGVLLRDVQAAPQQSQRLKALLGRYLSEHQVFADAPLLGSVGLWQRVPGCQVARSLSLEKEGENAPRLWHLLPDACPLAGAQAELVRAGKTLTAFDLQPKN